MTILYIQQLDDHTLSALDALLARCQREDGHGISIYRDLIAQHRPTPCTLLNYTGDKLTGFAAVFFFEHNEAEIALLVDPAYRHQGLGNELLRTLLTLIQDERPVDSICFSTPHGLHNTALTQRGFQYQSSEYEMQRHSEIPLPMNLPLTVREASLNDIAVLSSIDNQCFPASYPYSSDRLYTLLTRPQYTIYLALKDNLIIGKSHLAWHDPMARLSDIAVVPSMQRQGIGRALITHCLNQALLLHRPTVTLSVETLNQHALNLYQHLGFTVSSAIDYWSCPFLDLYEHVLPS
jgi:ribosomal-protein-alanine N-acetyltransferase